MTCWALPVPISDILPLSPPCRVQPQLCTLIRSSVVSNVVVRCALTSADRFALLWFADSIGDDVKPTDMRAFKIPAGKGVYIHPGTWHNGFYVNKRYTLQPYVQGASALRVLTRQGAVHARVSVSWLNEFSTLLRINLG